MCCSSQSYPGPKLVKLVVCALLFCSASVWIRPCWADSESLPVIPQPIQWVSGPVDTSLAGGAQIRVPAGFRFTDVKGARILLESAHAPIPRGLAGLMTPINGDWWITFDYSDSGHVTVTDQDRLDQDALLKNVWIQTTRERKALGLPELTHINWEIRPSYHPSRQFLDYAIRMEGFSTQDQKLTYVARFLSRRGVLEARSVVPWKERNDAIVFREALTGVWFKEGSRYADFQNGDKTASGALTELITADKGLGQASAARMQMPAGMTIFWLVLVGVAGLGITGIVIIARKIRQQKPAAGVNTPAPIRPPAPKRSSAPNGYNTFKFNMKPRPINRPVNGNGHANGNAPKRKRMFNYEKFYTEMVLQGPTPVIGEPANGINGYNGYETDNQQASISANGSVEAHSELIAHQKALIEEQKRLIHEQARLIEEKSKLIAEKNDLLDRQSQMIDNNLL